MRSLGVGDVVRSHEDDVADSIEKSEEPFSIHQPLEATTSGPDLGSRNLHVEKADK